MKYSICVYDNNFVFVDIIHDLSICFMAARARILPIMPAGIIMLNAALYAQNYAGT